MWDLGWINFPLETDYTDAGRNNLLKKRFAQIIFHGRHCKYELCDMNESSYCLEILLSFIKKEIFIENS